MKSVNKSVIFFFVSVICFFTFSSNKTEVLKSVVAGSDKCPLNENTYNTLSADSYFIQAVSSEESFNWGNERHSLAKRTVKAEFLLQSRNNELYRINRYSRYILFSKNKIDRIQPTDIIYPFQYFW